MSNQVIRMDSGPLYRVLELSEPVSVEDLQVQDQAQAPVPGPCRSCEPFNISTVLNESQEVPPECLPVPEGATIPCPDLQLVCTTGVPAPLPSGEVSVTEQLTVLPHQITILAPSGAVVCTIDIAGATFRPIRRTISCPTTEGVSCTCNIGPITCQGCRFETIDGVLVLDCMFTFVQTIQCQACPPVRGLERVSTRL